MTAKQLMDKNQVLEFDLWVIYWNYLLSLQETFKQELQTKLRDNEIESWVESVNDFFKEGNNRKGIAPQLEEIYFQLRDQTTSVRICVDFGNAPKIHVELVEDKQTDVHYRLREGFYGSNNVFSGEMIEIAAEWLKEAVISDSALDKFGYFGD